KNFLFINIPLLYALSHAPEILNIEQHRFNTADRIRRSNSKPGYSHIFQIKINKNNLRRIEEQHIEEMKEGIREGGNTVPGLQLVSGYERADKTQVAPYARCGNKEVRDMANHYLAQGTAASYRKLYELVTKYSTEFTLQRLTLSDVGEISLVDRKDVTGRA